MIDLTHYLSVQVTESDGTPVNVLLSKILFVAHTVAARRFGVAFPGASEAQSKPTSTPDGGYRSAVEEVQTYRLAHLRSKPVLGDNIQFFSDQETLWLISEAINRMPRGLKEFLDPTMPKPVPSSTGFVRYKRARNAVRTEATIQRELRRTLRRHPGDPSVVSDAALAERRNTIVETSRLPYISIHSASNSQDFVVRFEIVECDAAEAGDGFDGYGFGLNAATVPLMPKVPNNETCSAMEEARLISRARNASVVFADDDRARAVLERSLDLYDEVYRKLT